MNILRTPAQMRAWSLEHRCARKNLALVPTMGALHKGHASLIEAAVQNNNATVVSIFVNPTQFGPQEDLERYPRTWDDDIDLCEALGANAVYAPEADAMYPGGYASYVVVERLTEGLCGRRRPGHFRGVATIVLKLFNAALPNRAYFGQKDAQQAAVIKRMAADLDTGVEIHVLPIVRDPDGLAMSSRNRYLTEEDRLHALCISRGLFKAEALYAGGTRDAARLTHAVRGEMAAVDTEYVELVDAETMQPTPSVQAPAVLAVAARVGNTRLIDNVLLGF